MIDIRPAISERSGIRIGVYKKYEYKVEKQGALKVRYQYEIIDSFLLEKGCPEKILKALDPGEQLELKNFISDISFFKDFYLEQGSLSSLNKLILRVPDKLIERLRMLYIEAKKNNIDFLPHKFMMSALLKGADKMEEKIRDITGVEVERVEKIRTATEEEQTELNIDDKILFKTLLELNQAIGQTCTELEVEAEKLGKKKKIPPTELKDWAGVLKNRSPNKAIKKWCYAIAIEVLMAHKINPISLIGIKKVAYYWAIQRLDDYNLKQAVKKFIELFCEGSKKADQEAAEEAICKVYTRDLN